MNRNQTDPEQQDKNMPARSEGWTLDRGHDGERELDLDVDDERRLAHDDDAERRARMARAVPPSAGLEPSWQDIKGRFVDDPAGALAAAEQCVQRAVDERVRALQDEAAAVCARERDDDDASTEGLRTRLLRYQEYCERLANSSVH